MIAFALALLVIGGVVFILSIPKQGKVQVKGVIIPQIPKVLSIPLSIFGLALMGTGIWMGIYLFLMSTSAMPNPINPIAIWTTEIPSQTLSPTETPSRTPSPTETPSLTPTPSLTLCLPAAPDESGAVITVPANVYWCNTRIIVKQGQQLEFLATGTWSSGINPSGPEGDIFNKCGACPVVGENLGALVGVIGPLDSNPDQLNVVAFKISNSLTLVAKSDGVLYLAMNETIGDCIPGVPGSCYRDNLGSMQVTVKIK